MSVSVQLYSLKVLWKLEMVNVTCFVIVFLEISFLETLSKNPFLVFIWGFWELYESVEKQNLDNEIRNGTSPHEIV